MEEKAVSRNFIEQMIEKDLEEGVYHSFRVSGTDYPGVQ